MSEEELDAIGAGDRMMFSAMPQMRMEEMLPYPAKATQACEKDLAEVRKDGTSSYLRPDGKDTGNCRV